MFHLRSSSSSSKPAHGSNPTLFEVRLKSPYKNILIIKGSEYEAPSVFVSGNLVFALPEKVSVKKIGLKLIGTFKLDFMEVLTHHNRISSSNPVKEVKTVLQCDWDNLLVNSEGIIRVGNYGENVRDGNNNTVSTANSTQSSASNSEHTSGSSTPTAQGIVGHSAHSNSSSRTKMKRAGAPTTLQLPEPSIHTTPFENVMTPAGSNTFVLPAGNYELPFKCVLPGNIPETIEGLQSGSLFYKFEASIERSSSLLKSHNFVRHKYIRIFRTLSSNNIALTEDVSIENIWPGRVQYEVSIPRKAIPIGGVCPVNVVIIPLKKKLRLGRISASIIQHYVLKDSNEELYDHDQIVYDSELPKIPMESLGTDRWDIHASIHVPSDLKTVTQDCELKDGLIKVKHKLKFRIQLVNEEDSHISELRAKLPINLYINPHYKVLARNIELDNVGKVHIKPGGYQIFENGRGNVATPGTTSPAGTAAGTGTTTPSGMRSGPASPSLDPITGGIDDIVEEDEQDNAPPVYEQHIYDALYDALTGATSPPTSPRPIIARNAAASPGTATPNGEPGSYFDITPGTATPTHDLLNQYLSGQRSVRGRAGIGNVGVAEDEFVTNINSGARTPLSLRDNMSQLDLTALSRVPSYNEALQGDEGDDDVDLAPAYEDSSKGKATPAADGDRAGDVLAPPKPAMTKSHSSDQLPSVAHKGHHSAKENKAPTGTQSYFEVSRNNSSNDLFQLGMTRQSSAGNLSDLLQRRLAKKTSNSSHHSSLRNEK